jgi:hypothetical protein
MTVPRRITLTAAIAGLLWALAPAAAPAAEQDAVVLGVEAYAYGYPLVLLGVTKQVMTHTPTANGRRAPVNQFAHMRAFPTPDFQDMVSPNADTLYSFAWLDLAPEPIVLHVPDTQGRYYLMPMLDAWTNVFASPGKRTTGTRAGDFAIVKSGWKGTLPPGVHEIRAPTNMVWILGRTQTNGPDDYEAVRALQQQFTLTPLSRLGRPYTPPHDVPVDATVDDRTPPVAQVAKMDAAAFFGTLAELMVSNPPAAADAPILEKLKPIGLVPGRKFDAGRLDRGTLKALGTSLAMARQMLDFAARIPGRRENGWSVHLDLGRYAVDYGKRAVVALIGLGANLTADSVYSYTALDGDGRELNGRHRYAMHFAPGQTPPVNAFWSVAIYNTAHFFAANRMNRFALGDRDRLRFNPDGSLDLWLQHEAPPPARQSNWLPAPDGDFNLIARMYWPRPAILNGTYKIPAVQRIQ